MPAKAKLSVCAIVRDEAPYLAEWLAFHRLVGVERFYLYDDGSLDGTPEIALERACRDVVLTLWGPGRSDYYCPVECRYGKTDQVTAYNHFLRHFGGETEWCAFMDVDEYLHHSTVYDLRVALEGQESHLALWVPWLVFGSNGHQTRPTGTTIESYPRRGPPGEPSMDYWGKHGKIVAQPERVRYFGLYSGHNASFRGGCPVDERGRAVTGFINPFPSAETWRVNHYYHRSQEEARAKVDKPDNNCDADSRRTWERMQAHDLNDIEDRTILRYLPSLKAALCV